MSENNYGALMMKSVISASVNIDNVVQPGVYPVASGNAYSPDPDGGVLTIHPGPPLRRTFISNSLQYGISTYNTESFSWDSWSFVLSRSDLRSEVEGMGTWLSTHVQDDVVTLNLHDFLNAAINEITPEMFGGNLQKAFTLAAEKNLVLNLAAKTYVISEPIVFTGGITVCGKGRHKSKIQQVSGSCGIIQTLSATDDAVVYENFTLETTQKFNEDNRALVVDGSALIPSSGGQIEDRTRVRGSFRNLRICGSASSRLLGIGWGVGLDLISLGWYDINDIQIRGCATAEIQSESGTTPARSYAYQGIGILQRGGGWTVETYLSKVRIYFAEYGWYCPDYTEGVFFEKCNIVNVTNGIVGGVTDEKWSADPAGKLGVYQPYVDSCHINAIAVSIYMNKVSYGTFEGLFCLMDDHGEADSVNAVHLRNGGRNTVNNLNVVHYSTNTGISRKSLIFNEMSDSFINNLNSSTYSNAHEKQDVAVQFVRSSFRNKIDGINIARANTGILNGVGCGNNVIDAYRTDDVTNPVTDNAGDMVRENSEGRNVVFSPAGAAEYTITVTPRQQFSRRPLGMSYSVIRPTAVPMQVFYDRESSLPTAIVLKVKPITTSTLPNIECEISIILHD
ncbi:hypothetical protein [Klebsiella grimontii]|uniref:hypothetical protein n=1 Tax=Klebsiella grimontii TaxID=2058152 RepID=UPI0012B73DFC|nr:hypothetical protein [Klebsiella grimontii]